MPRGTRAGSSSWPPWRLLLGTAAVLRAECGATAAAAPADFDCLDVGAEWSAEKTAWCHEHHSVTLVTAAPKSKGHKCKEGTLEEWSEEKRRWCCSWEPTDACDSDKSVPVVAADTTQAPGGVPDKYDCLDTQSDGDGAVWTDEKVDWCMKHKGVKVLTREPATTAPPTHHHSTSSPSTSQPEKQQPKTTSSAQKESTVSTSVAAPEDEQHKTTAKPSHPAQKEEEEKTGRSGKGAAHGKAGGQEAHEDNPPSKAAKAHKTKKGHAASHKGKGSNSQRKPVEPPDNSDSQPAAHDNAEPLSTVNDDDDASKGKKTHSQPSEEGESDASKQHGDAATSCESDAAYYPLDMPGQGMTIEADLSSCQARCTKTTDCKSFSFWRLSNHCHLQDASAAKVGQLGFTSGSPHCSAVQEATKPTVAAADSEVCLHVDGAYYPLDSASSLPVTTPTAVECQAKCEADDACARFSFYIPTKSCHMQGAAAGTSTSWSAYYLAGPAQCRGKAMATISTEKFDQAALVSNSFLREEVLSVIREALVKDLGSGFPSQAVQLQLAKAESGAKGSQASFQVTALPTSDIKGPDLARALESAAKNGAELNQALAQLTGVLQAPQQKFSSVQLQRMVDRGQGAGISLPTLFIILGMAMMVGGAAIFVRGRWRSRGLAECGDSLRMLPGDGEVDTAGDTLPLYRVLPEDAAPQV